MTRDQLLSRTVITGDPLLSTVNRVFTLSIRNRCPFNQLQRDFERPKFQSRYYQTFCHITYKLIDNNTLRTHDSPQTCYQNPDNHCKIRGGERPRRIAAAANRRTIGCMETSLKARSTAELAALPIPGGWHWQSVTTPPHTWQLLLPADPDAFITAETQGEWPDPYWAQLWPAARTMAALIMAKDWPAETQVLELGCGNGFVGLAAAARGWQVTFSDYVPLAVELAVANALHNGYQQVAGEVIDWRDPPADHRFEQVIACECLYDPEHHAALLNTLEARLKPGGSVWLCDPGRGETAPAFVNRARANGWRVELFDQNDAPIDKLVRHEFRLIRLTRSKGE